MGDPEPTQRYGNELLALPEKLDDIQPLLGLAAEELKSSGPRSKEVCIPLARASVKSARLLRALPQMLFRARGETATREMNYNLERPNLAPKLHQVRATWSAVKRYLRFGPRRDPALERIDGPVSLRQLRNLKGGLARERTWFERYVEPRLDWNAHNLAIPFGQGADATGPASPLRAVRRRLLDSLPSLDGRAEIPPARILTSRDEPLRYERGVDSMLSTPTAGASSPATQETAIPGGTLVDVGLREGKPLGRNTYLKTRRYVVWFGTNRQLVLPRKGTPAFTVPGDLVCGSRTVYVPKSHRLGSLGSTWHMRLIRRIRGIESDQLKIESTVFLRPEAFKRRIAEELSKWTKRTALVVIHGYNVTFDEATLRTAQIGFDLRIDGITAFFAWPSRGSLLRYLQDGEEVQIAENYFVEFLNTLAEVQDLEEIHILAHSMGNRLLLRTVERLATAQSRQTLRAPIGQIILAAADVWTDLFRQNVSHYLSLAKRRLTSYSCNKDLALQFSRGMHGHDRVGLEPPIFMCSGVDSISASDMDLHGLGHGYYAEMDAVLHDLSDILHNNTHPDKRMRLEPVGEEPETYWVFRK